MNDEILREMLDEIKGLRKEVVVTNQRLDGLRESFGVLQQGVADVRFELHSIKDVLAERVIWHNDSVSIDTKEGTTVQGIIHKAQKK